MKRIEIIIKTAPWNKDFAIRQYQCATLIGCHWIELNHAAHTVISSTRDGCLNDFGSAKLLSPCGDVQGMQALEVGASFFRTGYQVHRLGGLINDRGCEDTDGSRDVREMLNIRGGN